MKTIILSLAITVSRILIAQEVPTPEFANRPYLLAADNYKNLEKVDVKMGVSEIKGGTEAYYIASGDKSTVRINNTETLRFIIKVESGTDPSDIIKLLRGKIFKGKRYFVFMKNTNSSKAGIKSGDMSNVIVNLDFKKIREGVYEIFLPSTLEPAEYAFSQKTGVNIFCFGIN